MTQTSDTVVRERVAVGPEDGPMRPYPITLHGHVVRGFGRGSKELGIPTANLPEECVAQLSDTLQNGIYFGWASVQAPAPPNTANGHGDDASWSHVFPMVMSLGWNPYYKNEKHSAVSFVDRTLEAIMPVMFFGVYAATIQEVHIIHQFPCDFYGQMLHVLVLGYLRPEMNYSSVDALITDIHLDIDIALLSLKRPAYAKLRNSPLLGLEVENNVE